MQNSTKRWINIRCCIDCAWCTWNFYCVLNFCWTFATCLPCFFAHWSSFLMCWFDSLLSRKVASLFGGFWPLVILPSWALSEYLRWSFTWGRLFIGIASRFAKTLFFGGWLPPLSSSCQGRRCGFTRFCALRTWRFLIFHCNLFAFRGVLVFSSRFACHQRYRCKERPSSWLFYWVDSIRFLSL